MAQTDQNCYFFYILQCQMKKEIWNSVSERLKVNFFEQEDFHGKRNTSVTWKNIFEVIALLINCFNLSKVA